MREKKRKKEQMKRGSRNIVNIDSLIMIKWTRWSNQSKKSTLFGFENYKKKWWKRPELWSMLLVYSWISELDDQYNKKK